MDKLQLDSDYDTIENRRSKRYLASDGFIYDTETASRWHYWEKIWQAGQYFQGQALYETKHGHFFLHSYHQWERFNTIEPLTTTQVIMWLQKHKPDIIEGYFGYMPEKGEGKPFTPL